MTKPVCPKNIRVLGIAPSSRGLGFAVMEGVNDLIAWGVKTVKSNKNARSLSNFANLVAQYSPDIIAIEDVRFKESTRSSRVRALLQEIATLAKDGGIKVMRFSRKQMMMDVSKDGPQTNHALAEHLANRFPEELSLRLPQKRKFQNSESSQMDIFSAVALTELCLRSEKSIRRVFNDVTNW